MKSVGRRKSQTKAIECTEQKEVMEEVEAVKGRRRRRDKGDCSSKRKRGYTGGGGGGRRVLEEEEEGRERL